MSVLIDTQVLIWILTDTSKIPIHVKRQLENSTVVLVSQVCLFEIAIKQKIGKLPTFSASITEIEERLKADGLTLMAIDNKHIEAYDFVPLYEDHRDPFDRLLLATALSENMTLVSADEKFQRYKPLINILW